MRHQPAQINIAPCRAPLDSPVMRDFVGLRVQTNALAGATAGFVRRLIGAGSDAPGIRADENPLVIVNRSVWDPVAALRDCAHRSAPADAFRRRQEWFEEADGAASALRWIPAGAVPTVEEGQRRLERLQAGGSPPEAFTFKVHFPPPGPASP